MTRFLPPNKWGNPYQYRQPRKHGEYRLYSYGKYSQQGCTGENLDITNC